MLEKKNNIHPVIKFLKHFPTIDKNVSISSSAKIIGNSNIKKNTKILDNVIIRGDGEKIEIGENCLFEKRSTVHVASDLLGTKIGNNCIIGAGSVVTKNVKNNEVVIGSPARFLRKNKS